MEKLTPSSSDIAARDGPTHSAACDDGYPMNCPVCTPGPLDELRTAQALDAAAEFHEHDPDTCVCNDDGFGNGPCVDCRRVFEQRRMAKLAAAPRFDVVSVRRSLKAAFAPRELSFPARARIRSREEDR